MAGQDRGEGISVEAQHLFPCFPAALLSILSSSHRSQPPRPLSTLLELESTPTGQPFSFFRLSSPSSCSSELRKLTSSLLVAFDQDPPRRSRRWNRQPRLVHWCVKLSSSHPCPCGPERKASLTHPCPLIAFQTPSTSAGRGLVSGELHPCLSRLNSTSSPEHRGRQEVEAHEEESDGPCFSPALDS